ncbi:glycosyltransferase [Microbacterium sp. SORGH_AS_0888]|uniref:glycosyltransferase n=1 Tax=Microbacterium sp. SORGH_AS_0888 TaxID=3041791 RepID=UPI00277E8DD7|nr:glycosyltransferase [Microbacterium sp. SORGH_AS_0888]MDQ1130522.1 poly(glycerol-phosphate) alpha-glucosyltransferase [Microbacterium sp. SORGH_AS_0888]
MPAQFPRAHYALLASRLYPRVDGGFTIAVLARARHMAAAGVDGGRGPLLLTVDPGSVADHAAHREAFVEAGLAASVDLFRNLFDDAAEDPAWLAAAALPGEKTPGVDYRTIADAVGRPRVSLPVVAAADWHLTEANVVVHGPDGDRVLVGFRGLYRVWLDRIVAELRRADPALPVVIVSESRQLGELLADWRPPGVCLIHTVHTSHRPPAVTAGGLWRGWFEVVDRFDAVLWPTVQQREDAIEDHGPHPGYEVVPNALPIAAGESRDAVPGRVVAVGRLAPGKRFEHILEAWERVARVVPGAHLDLYGDGPSRPELERVVAARGLGGSVTLHGHVEHAADELGTAQLMVQSTAYEGQGLAALEALSRGVPVVSYDIRYGPRDLLVDGSGILVPDGDVDALADAVIRILRDPALRARLGQQARARAADYAPEPVMAAMADAVRRALARTGSGS